MRCLLSGFVAVVVLSGCPRPPNSTDGGSGGGTGQAPELTSVSPDRGPLSGTTVVTVNGANFDDGATVKFGDKPGLQVIVSSKRKLTVHAPPGAAVGKVAVSVINLDAQSASLPNAYSYEAELEKTIDEALVLNPLDASDTSGSAMVTLSILSQVSAGALTKGAGQGMGIKAQVGVATALSTPPVAADFTWTDATYAGDADGPTFGDLLRDGYKGAVMLAGATAMASKEYRLAARFSTDNGTTWVLADKDGIANGFNETQISKLRVSRPQVDWCKLGGEIFEAPPQVKLKLGAAGITIYAQVYKMGVTQQALAGAGIKGQLGFGPATADPMTWTWVNATFNKDTGSGANDEYQATFPGTLAAGTYAFAFRFNFNDGPQKYCDADGSDNGAFTIDQAGTLQVTSAGIDRCKLQFPATLDARIAVASVVYGRVLAQGITETADAGIGIVGEVGYGPTTALPADPSWNWAAANYNLEAVDGTEEWKGNLTFPTAGSFSYAFRFKYLSGAYSYCDLDGSENGVQAAQLGAAVVKAVDVDDCQVDAPASVLAQPSSPSTLTHSHVWVTGVTDGTGQGTAVTSEVGYGPVGTQPATWTNWQAATFAGDATVFDTYSRTITAPAAVGTYDVAYRYRYQARPYVYCDLDGAANGYQTAQAAKLTVANATISACNLQFVDKTSVPSGDPVTAYVRIAVPGLSGLAGATPGLRAQFGVGPGGDNASSSTLWGWKDATYLGETALQTDEFTLTFQPAYNGSRAVSARASLDNGATWTYCDSDGSANGYQVAQQAPLNVVDHQDLGYCNLQAPAAVTMAFDAGGVVIYGQLYVAGGTPNATFPITAQLGSGKKIEDPGLAWQWNNAPFNAVRNNNNEYSANLFKPVGTSHYAFRFSRDGGSWCYGDLNGNGNLGAANDWAGFYGDLPDAGSNLGVLIVQ